MRPSPKQLCIGTWNVEGLTKAKLITLETYMQNHGIHLLCLQEVRKCMSDYSITEAGFLLICSGGQESPEYAGVGFLVHPLLRKHIHNFCQYSNRIAGIKIRTPGGTIAVVSAYAPHALRPFDERFKFFQNFTTYWQSISVNGQKMCFGDLNSRLYYRFGGEEQIIGPYYVKNQEKTMVDSMNRFMLLEFCTTTSTCVANTFFDHPPEKLVTYKSLGTEAHDMITPTNFAQLDLVLIEDKWFEKIIDIQSCSTLPLPTQHFLLWCTLDVYIEKHTKKSSRVFQNVALLRNPEKAEVFANRVADLMTKQIGSEEQNVDMMTSPTYVNDVFVEVVQKVSLEQLPPVPKRSVKSWLTFQAFAL